MTTQQATPGLQPGSPFPAITVTTMEGETLQLGKPANGADWQLVVIYRGQHCPICSGYLSQLATYREKMQELGIDLVAASADSREQLQTQMTRSDGHHFEGINFPIGCGLTLADMQAMGLYISDPRSAEETDHPFAEPGLFVINQEGTVQVVDISNVPFARPELSSLVSGLGWIKDPANNYPIRGRREYL